MSTKKEQKQVSKKNIMMMGYTIAIVLVAMAGISLYQRNKYAEPDDNMPSEPEEDLVTVEDLQPTAEILHSGDYDYYEDENGIAIVSYSGSNTKLEIPSELEGKTVYKIADAALANHPEFTSVTIPGSITWIGASAFYADSGIETLTIEPGVEEAIIGYFAFNECDALTSVTIPGNYRQIDTKVFADCDSLEYFKWEENPKSEPVQRMGGFVFENCGKLTEVHLSDSVSHIEDANGYKNTEITIYAPEDSKAIEIAKEYELKYEIEKPEENTEEEED